jgi:hypothetical protein
MTDRIVRLRQTVEPPLRRARQVAIGAAAVGAGVVVVGGVLVVAYGVRRRRRKKTLRGRAGLAAEAIGSVVAHPAKTAKDAKKSVQDTVDGTREKLKEELRDELRKELEPQEPRVMRLATAAARTAATAAVPIIIRQLEKRATEMGSRGRR